MAGKKKSAQRKSGDKTELIFDQMVRSAKQFVTDIQFQGYKIFTVNGAEPSVIGKSVFVPAGTCRIELQYIDTDYATRRVSNTTVYEKQMLAFDVRSNEKYKISFDEKCHSFRAEMG